MGVPPRRPGGGSLQHRESPCLCRQQSRGLCQCARMLPPLAAAASDLRLVELRLWRQSHSMVRASADRPPGFLLCRHQEGQRSDGAQLCGLAHSYAALFGIPATALRFFTIYGEWGRPDMAFFKFADAIMRGVPVELYNHGRSTRDFTY